MYTPYHYQKGVFDNGTWNDTKYAVWLRNPDSNDWKERAKKLGNFEVFSRHFKELKDDIEKIPESVKKIVVLHTAPFGECIIPKEEPCPFDAYEGSKLIGEFLEDISNEKLISVICGHRHKKLYLEKGEIKVYRSPVGYLEENDTNYEMIAEKSIGEFEF